MRLKLMALLVGAMAAAIPAFAGNHSNCDEQCSSCTSKCCNKCPRCGDVCYPTVKKDKEKKHCWVVESEKICIPKVRFPWEKDCNECGDCCSCEKKCPQPKCGRTKCVKVLMKCEYSCPTCKYSWKAPPRGCGKGGCDQASAGDEHNAPASARELPPQPPTEARRSTNEDDFIYGYEERR